MAHQDQPRQRLIKPFAHSVNKPPNIAEAVIVCDGFFQRQQYSENNYGFWYADTPKFVAVEPIAFHGQTVARRHQNDRADYSKFPWYLNLKSFLYLKPTSKSIFVWTDELRKYISDNAFSAVNNAQYREWGAHVFVGNDHSLRHFKIYKPTRLPEDNTATGELAWIHDIMPKARVLKVSKNKYDYVLIKTMIILKHRNIQTNNNMYARWWFRFGRENTTRVVECDERFAQHMNAYINKKIDPYFGVYVHDRAKLVVADPIGKKAELIAGPGQPGGVDFADHNRTLVMGGVFVIFNTLIRVRFSHELKTNIPFSRFITHFNQFNAQNRVTLTDPDHPVIVVRALPSNGETLCWHIGLHHGEDGTLVSMMDVPSFGMTRCNLHDWSGGTQYVRNAQQRHKYEQNVIIPGYSKPITITSAKAAHFEANDQPLNLMDIQQIE